MKNKLWRKTMDISFQACLYVWGFFVLLMIVANHRGTKLDFKHFRFKYKIPAISQVARFSELVEKATRKMIGWPFWNEGNGNIGLLPYQIEVLLGRIKAIDLVYVARHGIAASYEELAEIKTSLESNEKLFQYFMENLFGRLMNVHFVLKKVKALDSEYYALLKEIGNNRFSSTVQSLVVWGDYIKKVDVQLFNLCSFDRLRDADDFSKELDWLMYGITDLLGTIKTEVEMLRKLAEYKKRLVRTV